MRSGTLCVFVVALGIGTVGLSREARALGPVDLEIGARIGGGTSPFGGQPSPLGFGLGARAGGSVFSFYGGLSFMYYVGESSSASGGSSSPSAHSFLYGVDVGYGTGIGPLTLRTTLGIGNFNVNTTLNGNNTVNNLYLEPCLTGEIAFGFIFVGADISLIVLPGISDPANLSTGSSWDTAFTAHGQVGIKF